LLGKNSDLNGRDASAKWMNDLCLVWCVFVGTSFTSSLSVCSQLRVLLLIWDLPALQVTLISVWKLMSHKHLH